MPSLGVFCFLWDDPLFNPGAESAKMYLEDSEFIEFRRQERLLALELIYIKMAALESLAAKWKEAAGRHCWALTQVIERAEVPFERRMVWPERRRPTRSGKAASTAFASTSS